ncbi:MAG: hypothetical protein LBU00_06315 [Treponema sp.]|jgi:hypothetical protein|nr:hypothetical protein [Treponema sp.]
MKRDFAVMFFVTALILVVAVGIQGLEFSGLLDSTVSFAGDPGGGQPFAYDWEEYANLRMRTPVGDRADFYGAVNLIAAAGSSAVNAAALGVTNAAVGPTPSAFTAGKNYAAGAAVGAGTFMLGENYAAAMELERLYFRLRGEALDADVGLMRLGFGYGQAFSPSDFLNPKNPLFPDARPRAVLGAAISAYPQDTLKILAFTVTPKNPLNSGGGGFITGTSADMHGDRASVQLLYAYETPREGSPAGIHRSGLSLKADLTRARLGFAVDLLYTYNPESRAGIGGLAADAGFDYSFGDGRFYVLTEYLYSSSASATTQSAENALGLSARHNLCGTILYHINDYTQVNLTCLFGLENGSVTPVLTLDHDLFQGVTLTLSGQASLDKEEFNGVSTVAKVRLRF